MALGHHRSLGLYFQGLPTSKRLPAIVHAGAHISHHGLLRGPSALEQRGCNHCSGAAIRGCSLIAAAARRAQGSGEEGLKVGLCCLGSYF